MGLNLDVLLNAINQTYTNVQNNKARAMAEAQQQDMEAAKYNRDVVQFNRQLAQNQGQFESAQAATESRFGREQAQQDAQFAKTKEMQETQFNKNYALSSASTYSNIAENNANIALINQRYQEAVQDLKDKQEKQRILMQQAAPIEALYKYRDERMAFHMAGGASKVEAIVKAETEMKEKSKELMPEKTQDPKTTYVKYKTPDGKEYDMNLEDLSKANAEVYKETMLAPYKAKTEKPTPRPAEITDAIGFITASDPVFAAKVEQILSQDSPFKNSAEALLQVYGKKIMEKDYQDSEGFKNLKNNVIKSLNEMDFQIQQEAQARYAEYQQNNIPFTGYDIYGTAKSGMAAANPNTMKIVEDRNRILREAAEMQKNMTLKAAPNLNFNMNTNKSKAGDRRGL